MTTSALADSMETSALSDDPTSTCFRPRAAVVVHGGARDSYQMALALEQAGSLERLVTDLFWPADHPWAGAVKASLPNGLRELVERRTAIGLPRQRVQQCVGAGFRNLILDRLPSVPFSVRRQSTRAADAALGRAAGRRARAANAGLVAYSYFAYDAIRTYGRPSMLFQVHPHPATVRQLLHTELEAHPECAASLLQEWELALPEEDYLRLVEEPKLATCLLAASSFTRQSLIENGVPKERIAVVPYGVDLQKFHPGGERTHSPSAPLQLLFVGRINQRKGVKYLLDALSQFSRDQVHLTVCGKVVDDLGLFQSFGDQVQVRPSVSVESLVAAYQAADLFVFPSVVEGFGQVLLESLACGLPILSTTHTAAPDLITDGTEGFIIEPRRVDMLVERIAWALNHRAELHAMREQARTCAEQFTWERFRTRSAHAVHEYLTNHAVGVFS